MTNTILDKNLDENKFDNNKVTIPNVFMLYML